MPYCVANSRELVKKDDLKILENADE